MLKANVAREPNYALTPLGAKVNRVFIVGTVTEKQNIGTDSRAFYRLRLTDPTGVFFVTVGEYQPEALEFVEKLELPAFIAVIGKVKSYEPDGGGLYLSIRPENIYPADQLMRDKFLLSAIKSLRSRMGALMETRKMTAPSMEQLKALGFSNNVSDGILRSIKRYGDFSMDQYQTYLVDALQFLTNNNGHDDKHFNYDKAGSQNSDSVSKSIEERVNRTRVENDILDIINNTPGINKLGVNWNELLGAIKSKGIDRKLAEEIIRDLMSKGVIYEPILGVIKRIG
jgi:RPA family protein